MRSRDLDRKEGWPVWERKTGLKRDDECLKLWLATLMGALEIEAEGIVTRASPRPGRPSRSLHLVVALGRLVEAIGGAANTADYLLMAGVYQWSPELTVHMPSAFAGPDIYAARENLRRELSAIHRRYKKMSPEERQVVSSTPKVSAARREEMREWSADAALRNDPMVQLAEIERTRGRG